MRSTKNKYNKRGRNRTFAKGTMQGLVGHMTGSGRIATHEANFRRILPSAMQKLVTEGLFEPDGNGSYRITAKGQAKLRELE